MLGALSGYYIYEKQLFDSLKLSRTKPPSRLTPDDDGDVMMYCVCSLIDVIFITIFFPCLAVWWPRVDRFSTHNFTSRASVAGMVALCVASVQRGGVIVVVLLLSLVVICDCVGDEWWCGDVCVMMMLGGAA